MRNLFGFGDGAGEISTEAGSTCLTVPAEPELNRPLGAFLRLTNCRTLAKTHPLRGGGLVWRRGIWHIQAVLGSMSRRTVSISEGGW